jgi:hypothetical protein
MPGTYHDGHRFLQDQFDTRRLADRIDERDVLLDHYPQSQFVVQVRAGEVFPNCPRYIHKYRLVERSRFVPKVSCPMPVPDWKRLDWAIDVLAANDPARGET